MKLSEAGIIVIGCAENGAAFHAVEARLQRAFQLARFSVYSQEKADWQPEAASSLTSVDHLIK